MVNGGGHLLLLMSLFQRTGCSSTIEGLFSVLTALDSLPGTAQIKLIRFLLHYDMQTEYIFNGFRCLAHRCLIHTPNSRSSDVDYVTRPKAKVSSTVSKYLHTTIFFFFFFLLPFISCALTFCLQVCLCKSVGFSGTEPTAS